MILELQQKLIPDQKLIMTPQLQQAIKLLQLTRVELLNEIRQELEENPMLEKVEDSEADDRINDAIDLYSYLDPYRPPNEKNTGIDVKEMSAFEAYTPVIESLTDHLLGQLLLSSPTSQEKHIGSIIAGSLDRKGYLKASIEELVGISHAEPNKVEQVLFLMQSFDPPGVCARDLKECLLIQAARLGLKDSLLTGIVEDHLKDLERRDYKAICRSLKADWEDVVEAVDVIQGLEPIPARQFGHNEIRYIVPDVFVYRMEGNFVIELNRKGIPNLRISPVYRKILTDIKKGPREARDYVIKKLNAAKWLINSIHEREQTIYRVMECILKLQSDFFEKGVSYLKPMVLRDVAEEIGRAESTISRATANKYAQTPRGLFSLKYFFNTPISRFDGQPVASVSVQEKIKDVIAGEDPQKPYSDESIANLLKASNINIARRTVAKYREKMKILPSSRRKQI